MSFGDVARQGDDLANAGALRRSEAILKSQAAAEDEAQFRDELVAFGNWFAEESSAKHLPTQRLYFELDSDPSAPKRPGLFRRAVQQPARRKSTRPGWAVFPMSPYTGEPHLGQPRMYGSVESYGDVVSRGKPAYLCLTVDEIGRVLVGAAREDGIWVSDSVEQVNEHIGKDPNRLTRSQLLHQVADLGGSINLDTDPVGMERDRQAQQANNEMGCQVLGLYVAQAKRILDVGYPHNPFEPGDGFVRHR